MNLFIVCLLFSIRLFASINIAFIEMRGHDGKLVQLEPNGRFAHLAISYHGSWLHAYPYRGVEVISYAELSKIGQVLIINAKNFSAPSDEQVNKYLDKEYDSDYSWSDEKIYCAELVGKLLNIPPQPMSFDAPIWPEKYKKLNGQPGLSPDDIYSVVFKN